ncbi:MAG: GNAT family N-acetyltransferase [Candidatus Acidiferrales bacterium]
MTSPAVPQTIQVRHCSELQHFDACVRVQERIWGRGLAVPSTMIVAVHHAGGQVLGAFDGADMIGFALAFLGMGSLPARSGSAQRIDSPFLHSHIAAVLPEYRDRGVGRSLKLFQREDALQRGIGLIEWTFDPLELKNAHFNLVRLGAVARRIIPNCYGITASALHAEMPTDRLVAEWWLASDRVKNIIEGRPAAVTESTTRVSIPADISERKSADRDTALRIQSAARAQFEKWFSQGYAATSVEKRGEVVDYILEPADAIGGLRLPPSFGSERSK